MYLHISAQMLALTHCAFSPTPPFTIIANDRTVRCWTSMPARADQRLF